jgi:transcriptional regulator with AAA-type ATPase domain
VSDSESRFEAVHVAGVTDLIGREHEIDFLLERKRLAWKGEGQVVLISGEPGIGKSRLAVIMHHAERFLHGWPMAARQQSVRLDRCRSLALRHV